MPQAQDNAERTAQRKAEKLIATMFIVGGFTTLVSVLFDGSSELLTPWDEYGGPITSSLYLISGLMMVFRPQWLTAAVLMSMVPTSIYEHGVFFWAIHFPSEASYYSAAASGPFFPLLYVVLFITLPKGAPTLGWIHCAGLYVQFIINSTWLTAPVADPGRVAGEHVLMAAMMAHPVYIIALTYIVQLRERLMVTQREAHRNKQDFLAMLSHEIRNLLQTMVIAIDQLDLKLKAPTERRAVSRLQTAAAQLQTYLTDVSDLTRLESPALAIQPVRVDLATLLLDVREEWLPEAKSRELQIESVPSSHDLVCVTDQSRLRQVISNLVSNGLKYTEAGGVTFSAQPSAEQPGWVELEVTDTGIGIEEAQLERIFLPYVRLDNAKHRRSTGSGLGLTIVRRLVESIGGTIRVDSRLNEGTRFVVAIPSLTPDDEANTPRKPLGRLRFRMKRLKQERSPEPA